MRSRFGTSVFAKKETVQKFYKTVGKKIREQRIKRGYDLQTLASLCGLSNYTVNAIEKGKVGLMGASGLLVTYVLICAILKIKISRVVPVNKNRPRPRPTKQELEARKLVIVNRRFCKFETYREQIVEMHSRGMTIAAIARELGMSTDGVKKVVIPGHLEKRRAYFRANNYKYRATNEAYRARNKKRAELVSRYRDD